MHDDDEDGGGDGDDGGGDEEDGRGIASPQVTTEALDTSFSTPWSWDTCAQTRPLLAVRSYQPHNLAPRASSVQGGS